MNLEELSHKSLDQLQLTTSRLYYRLAAGVHRSRSFSEAKIEFTDYKMYEAGDDLKQIDWKLFARTDRLYVKKSNFDTSIKTNILFDMSGSMGFGDKKFLCAQALSHIISHIIEKQGDYLGLLTFNDKFIYYPPRCRKNYYSYLRKELERVQPGKETRLSQSLDFLFAQNLKRSLIIIISDFLCEPEEVINRLKRFHSLGSEILLCNVFDPHERTIPYENYCEFLDLETKESMIIQVDKIRSLYLETVNQFYKDWQKSCLQMGIPFVDFSTETSVVDAISIYLKSRSHYQSRRSSK